MSLHLEGRDIVVVHHDATYNCCMRISYALTREDRRLILDESERLIGGGCDCVCCYQLAARIGDMPPGTWTVVLRGAGFEFTDTIVVPVGWPARAPEPALAGCGQSACGASEIVGLDPPAGSWGALKSAYR